MKKKNNFLVKFTIAAAMVGFFSPSVSVQTTTPSGSGFGAIPIEMNVSLFTQAEARRGGGGGARRGGGGGARRGGGANRGRSSNRNRNVNRNSNRNSNRNVNRNVNRNINVNHYGGVHHRHYGHYHGHPILRFTTAVAIGSMIAAATMPTTCTTVIANNITYKKCSNSYYQPFYQGDTLVYKVVVSPY